MRNTYYNNPSPQRRPIQIIPSLCSVPMNIQLGDFEYYYMCTHNIRTFYVCLLPSRYSVRLFTPNMAAAVKHLPLFLRVRRYPAWHLNEKEKKNKHKNVTGR
jgi:hypothetical protein